MSIRAELLEEQKIAQAEIDAGTSSQPLPIREYKVVKDEEGNEHQTRDFVSYDPTTDKFKIYARSVSIEFAGREFKWIFDALRRIGSDIPTYTVIFTDSDIKVAEVEVACGDIIDSKDIPVIDTPDDPFIGWFLDEEFTEPWDSNSNILVDNFVLYAEHLSDAVPEEELYASLNPDSTTTWAGQTVTVVVNTNGEISVTCDNDRVSITVYEPGGIFASPRLEIKTTYGEATTAVIYITCTLGKQVIDLVYTLNLTENYEN